MSCCNDPQDEQQSTVMQGLRGLIDAKDLALASITHFHGTARVWLTTNIERATSQMLVLINACLAIPGSWLIVNRRNCSRRQGYTGHSQQFAERHDARHIRIVLELFSVW